MPNLFFNQVNSKAGVYGKRSASESDVNEQVDVGIFDVGYYEGEISDSVFTCVRSVQVSQIERTKAHVKFIKSDKSLTLLGDLVSLLKDETRDFLKERLFSVIIFKLLKTVGVKFEVIFPSWNDSIA